jgi:hypothetical protein
MSKLYNTEVASVVKEKSVLELSAKSANKTSLTNEDREAIDILDNFAREMGESGKSSDNNKVMAEYIKQTIEPTIFEPEESLLGNFFDFGTIGEFDEKAYTGLPKNTIKVYDASRGGNVPKSYVDPTVYAPKKFSLQAEAELNYSDLRRNGFKSIAKMTELAVDSFNAEKFFRIFAGIDNALNTLSGDQNISTGSALTQANADILSRYLRDMAIDGNPMMLGLSTYTDDLSRMSGQQGFMSEDMKNEFNKLGLVNTYRGIQVQGVPYARLTADGKHLIPDKRIFGIAGKIGQLDVRGGMRNYETYDNNAEKVTLKFTGYEIDYVIYHLDRIARITFA